MTIRHPYPIFGDEYVLVSMQRTGTCVVSQNDRSAWLQPGELVCYDTTRPYTIGFAGPFRTALARIPRALLGIEPDLLRNTYGSTPRQWSQTQDHPHNT